MRGVASEVLAALEATRLIARDFLWLVVRDRESGDPVTDGMWSDVGDYSCEVINPDTNGPVTRTFHGAGTLISISSIPLVSNITVQTINVVMSQVADRVNDLVRGYDCRQAKVEIFRGLFDPDTRQLVAPAIPRFVGFVDDIEIVTPSEDGDGSVTLRCVSHTREMTRYNPDTRSHASQLLRSSSDAFFMDVAVVGEWEHFWGRSTGKVATAPRSIAADAAAVIAEIQKRR